MKKSSIALLLFVTVAIAIFLSVFLTITLKESYELAEELAYLNSSYMPNKIGHVDAENKIIYVGCTDRVYETAEAESSVLIVWDILPDCVEGSLAEYFDQFNDTAYGVGLTYTAASTNGRFLIQALDGKSFWVEPSAQEFLFDDDTSKAYRSIEDALVDAKPAVSEGTAQ